LADGVAEKDFWRVVKVGFSAKRKQVVNNLAAGLRIDRQLVKASLLELGLDEKIRAQNLAISDWFRLAKSLINHFN
jgi:16S rRNA (adenine1518-N6/adenine1519-N6)-dimethyltransferase